MAASFRKNLILYVQSWSPAVEEVAHSPSAHLPLSESRICISDDWQIWESGHVLDHATELIKRSEPDIGDSRWCGEGTPWNVYCLESMLGSKPSNETVEATGDHNAVAAKYFPKLFAPVNKIHSDFLFLLYR